MLLVALVVLLSQATQRHPEKNHGAYHDHTCNFLKHFPFFIKMLQAPPDHEAKDAE